MNQNHSNIPPLPKDVLRVLRNDNPWEDPKENIPRLHPAATVLLALLCLSCALYLPFLAALAQPYLSVALLALCAFVVVMVVRAPLCTTICALLTLGAYLMGGGAAGYGLVAATAMLSQIVLIGMGTYALTTCRSRWLAVVPAAAYGLALLLCGDPMLAVLSLVSFPAVGLLSYHTMENRSRVSGLCLTSAILGLCALFGVALLWYRTGGEGAALTISAILAALEGVREDMIAELLAMEELVALMDKTYEGTGLTAASVIRSVVELLFNLLPGLLITLFNLIAFAAQRLCICCYRNNGMEGLVTRASRLFVLSVPAAVLFLLSALVLLFAGEMTLALAVVYNLAVILFPGMLLCGLHKLIGDIKTGGVSKLWLGLMIGAALLAPYMLLYCLAISGALNNLLRPLMIRAMKMAKGCRDLGDRRDLGGRYDAIDRHDPDGQAPRHQDEPAPEENDPEETNNDPTDGDPKDGDPADRQ